MVYYRMSFELKKFILRHASHIVLIAVACVYIVFLAEMLGHVDAQTLDVGSVNQQGNFQYTALRPSPTPSLTPTSTPTPTPVIYPYAISIPALGIVQSPLEYLGVDSEGSMQTPQHPLSIGWLSIGPKPGEIGNAIFTAHYDDALGQPAAFYYLKNIPVGSEVAVHMADGTSRVFHVEFVGEIDAYGDAVGAITRQTDYPSITLVTCHGSWDARNGIYSKRLVVYGK